MRDAELRRLEQRYRESGDPEAERSWLLRRVRLGLLSRARLQLAADLGHPSLGPLAESPLGPSMHREVSARGGLSTFVEDVSQADPRALLVAVYVLTRDKLPGMVGDRDREKVGALLSALAGWLQAPAGDQWAKVTAAREVAWPDLGVEVIELPSGAIRLLQAPGSPTPGGPGFVPYEESLAIALLMAESEEPVAQQRLAMLLAEIAAELGVPGILERLRAEFVPWLLSPDPPASSPGA